MAEWGKQQLKTGQWGLRGYFPKGEKLPQDEELLGQIIQVKKKDGSSQTKRITGIEEWFKSPKGYSTVSCESEDAEPDDNGANPNLPSAPRFAPPSAQETRIPLYTPDGVFQTYMKNDWWQPTPEMKAQQEEFKRVQRDKMLNGIPTTSHTKHQVENGYPDKCACQFCKINDPSRAQPKGPHICKGCQYCRNMEKRFGKEKWQEMLSEEVKIRDDQDKILAATKAEHHSLLSKEPIPEVAQNEKKCQHCQRVASVTTLNPIGQTGEYECVYEELDACNALSEFVTDVQRG